VDEPRLHLWDSGVIRITRHPQALGQLLWCLAHTLWIGNSFMVVTSGALMAHHAFGCWHGDARLRRKWGEVRSHFADHRRKDLQAVACIDALDREHSWLVEHVSNA